MIFDLYKESNTFLEAENRFLKLKSLGYDAVGTQSGIKHKGLVTFDLLRHRIKDCIETSFLETNEPVFGVICAAVSQIDRCHREKEMRYKVNVENTIRLIQDLDGLGIKPVFISTSWVYDGEDGYYNEECPHNPICEYGKHKAIVEGFIENNMPSALILRLEKKTRKVESRK